MADISTGRQRGIVPFVDETTGRLPDQYLPQGVIDLEGDLEQAVSDASASATAAQQSASQAQSNATAANSSAQAAAASAESAQTATESAASSKDAAARSASEASESAQAAEASKTNAAASASAAETSETNAAASASAAQASETNAAASATAAQQAVDGFGLEVGTTTTGEPGSDAAVEIQKTGTKYTANFTIPRGDKGADGVNENVPLGTASGIVAQASDAYPALPRKVQVHGRTIENLWPVINGETSGNISITYNDGLFTLQSDSISGNAAYFGLEIQNNIQAGKTYSGKISNKITSVNVRVQYQTSKGITVANIAPEGSTFEIPSDATEIRCVVAIENISEQTINDSFRVILVEGDTVPVVFVPSGVHTVEPTKIIVAGKNLIPIGKISSGSSAGINWKANDDKTFTVSGTSTNTVDIPFIPPYSSWNLPKGRYTVKAIGDLQNNIQIFIRQKNASTWFTSLSDGHSVANVDIDEDTVLAECSVRILSGVTLENSVYGIQIELGNSDTSYETPNIKSVDFTQSISLSDGDTLTIDRDGTTRIVHAEGEPTVLDNVTLPELPDPTFNVYTTGGYIQPTVDVDYEKDVNLVLEALEAKIAALQVADKTN